MTDNKYSNFCISLQKYGNCHPISLVIRMAKPSLNTDGGRFNLANICNNFLQSQDGGGEGPGLRPFDDVMFLPWHPSDIWGCRSDQVSREDERVSCTCKLSFSQC